MGLDPHSRVRFNLSGAAILLLDPTPLGLSICVQILSGLGAKHFHRCATVDEAKSVVATTEIDLMVVDSMSDTGEGYDFVRWVRTGAPPPNTYAPILLTAAHTRTPDVARARDCGAHFVIAKPIAPIVMLERIIWISKEGRAFLLTDTFVGPDRRVHDQGPPPGRPGRRQEDRAAVLGDMAVAAAQITAEGPRGAPS